ncbi:MAG: hypothetical protein HZC10_06060 [Nitrospirae bacterium]|nr:hypothetical protein [Nitrospirota bacterium]
MTSLIRGLAIFIILFLSFACQKNIQTVEILKPNWSEATIKATGIDRLQNDSDIAVNRLKSLQRAEADAFKNLKEELFKIMIADTKTLGEYIKDKEAVKGQVEDFVKRGRIAEVRYMPNHSIEVDVELYLGKGFESIILK